MSRSRFNPAGKSSLYYFGSRLLCLPFLALLLLLAACGGPAETPGPVAAVVVTSMPTPTLRPATTEAITIATPLPTATRLPPTPDLAAEPGGVSGSVCYPSAFTPPMTLFVENMAGGPATKLKIRPGQKSYELVGLPPGDYIVSAQTVGTALAGLYSGAAPCGQGAACTDHRLLPFEIKSGQITAGIDLCNWYNPPGITPGSAGQTVTGQVIVTALQNTDVFSGPELAYASPGLIPPLQPAPAVGRSADGDWLQIRCPSAAGGLAWIYRPLLWLSADPERLPVVTVAPPPGQRTPAKLAPAKDQFTPPTWPARWSTGYNESVVHFKGSISDEQGRPINGFSILADNGTWSVLSHPSGASRHYPDYDDGEWDLIILNATDAVGWWTLTVVSYDCPDFEKGFNAQCKQFTRLSENQVVKVVYPDGSVIKADWVCHRDCDKGLYVRAYRP